jgi:hypothetical protein
MNQPQGTPSSPNQSNPREQEVRVAVRMRIREFTTPPVRDALVLGKKCPIKCPEMRRALAFMQTAPFEHIEFEDDTISDILVRSAILRRIPRDRLICLVIRSVKPYMGIEDIIQVDFEAEAIVDDEV